MSMQIEEKLQNEEISLAPFAKRIMAFSIDEIIVSFLFMIIYWEPLSTSTNYDDARNLVLNLFWQVVALKVIYHTFFVWYYGASLGQMITKTMCINVEILDKPNLTQSLVRGSLFLSWLCLGTFKPCKTDLARQNSKNSGDKCVKFYF